MGDLGLSAWGGEGKGNNRPTHARTGYKEHVGGSFVPEFKPRDPKDPTLPENGGVETLEGGF